MPHFAHNTHFFARQYAAKIQLPLYIENGIFFISNGKHDHIPHFAHNSHFFARYFYRRQGGYVFTFVGLFVCLFVCQQSSLNSYGRIFTKFSGQVQDGPRTNRLVFGENWIKVKVTDAKEIFNALIWKLYLLQARRSIQYIG